MKHRNYITIHIPQLEEFSMRGDRIRKFSRATQKVNVEFMGGVQWWVFQKPSTTTSPLWTEFETSTSLDHAFDLLEPLPDSDGRWPVMLSH